MKYRGIAVALLLSALTACQGASTYTPPINASSPEVSSNAAAPPSCSAKAANIPGKYVTMFAAGTRTGSTFTSAIGEWTLLAYTKSAAAPSSKNSAPKLTGSASLLYSGTYTMTKTKKKGCVLFVVGKVVDALAGTPSNGEFSAGPVIEPSKFKVTVADLGLMSLKLTNLTASGGRGTATLTTQNFKPYDTATIVLSKPLGIGSP